MRNPDGSRGTWSNKRRDAGGQVLGPGSGPGFKPQRPVV